MRAFCSIFSFFILCSCASIASEIPTILVSLAPYQEFVEALLPGEVKVEVLVPPSVDPHSFEPTPSQTLIASKAMVWLKMGAPFEEMFEKASAGRLPLKVVDLRQGLNLIMTKHSCHHGHHHHHESADPHIWMSPRMMAIQTQTIADALLQCFPKNKEIIEKNAMRLIARMESLDQQIAKLLKSSKGATLLSVHPAYGYFCRDYDLKLESLDMEGRPLSAKQQLKMIQMIREKEIDYLFTQEQFTTHRVQVFADELKLQTVLLDPFATPYEKNLLEVAKAFAKEGENERL